MRVGVAGNRQACHLSAVDKSRFDTNISRLRFFIGQVCKTIEPTF